LNLVRTSLGLLMLLFIGVQYNDPDGPLWALVYALPALLMGVCVLRARWLEALAGRWLVTAVVVALALAAWLAWPQTPGFWRQEVWWEEEAAREGMGLMIAATVAACALPVAWRRAAGTPRSHAR